MCRSYRIPLQHPTKAMEGPGRAPPLRLLVSDELGQLKVVQTADGAQLGTAALAATWGQPDKSQAVDRLELGSAGGLEDTATAALAVARCGGHIELRSPLTGHLLGSIPPAAPGSGNAGSNGGGNKQQEGEAARVRGLHLLWGEGQAAHGLPAVLSVTQGGTARLHVPAAPAAQQQEVQHQQQEQQEGQQQQAGGAASWEQRLSWQVPADVCCTAYDPASKRLAVGCQGAELRLFDAGSGEPVFSFKGGKPNMVGLVDRLWNTAIAFLPPAPSSSSKGGDSSSSGSGAPGGSSGAAGTRLLVGTGYHKVRLYDSEAGKRPQMELSWGEGRITCLAVEPDGRRCWVGNGAGQLEVLDLPARRFKGAIKGLAGSARVLAAHPSLPVLASVGLDRYLRLHDRSTRQLLAKVYLKTLPTGLAFCPTDASMLPPAQEPAAEASTREEKRRRERRESEGGVAGSEEAADGGDSEGEEEAAAGERRHRRSKQRGEGGSSGKKRRKGGKEGSRRRAAADDGSD